MTSKPGNTARFKSKGNGFTVTADGIDDGAVDLSGRYYAGSRTLELTIPCESGSAHRVYIDKDELQSLLGFVLWRHELFDESTTDLASP